MIRPLVLFAVFTFIILIGIITFTGCLQSTALCITIIVATTTLIMHELKIYKLIKTHVGGDDSATIEGDSSTAAKKEGDKAASSKTESFKEGPLQIASKKEDDERSRGVFKDGYVPTGDPIADALAGIEEVHSLPMYSKNQSLLSNLNWRRKQEARYQGYMDLRKIDDHKMRFRMNKSRDGHRRAMNSEFMDKYFNEELHEREKSQWWGM